MEVFPSLASRFTGQAGNAEDSRGVTGGEPTLGGLSVQPRLLLGASCGIQGQVQLSALNDWHRIIYPQRRPARSHWNRLVPRSAFAQLGVLSSADAHQIFELVLARKGR